MIQRQYDTQQLKERLEYFPVVAILGPRQCGKTTLARSFSCTHYFDLENPQDIARLTNPQLALGPLSGLIIIDEIQRIPELFPVLRFLVDTNPRQRYLILGSASRELIRQSSESLAGRIAYFNPGCLSLADVGASNLPLHWMRGGYPRSFLAPSDPLSKLWLDEYITTYIERDLPMLGISIPPILLRRFWTMLAHYHGNIVNYSDIARSLSVSDTTVRKYLDILEGTFMVRILRPWYVNIGKRLVKNPKVYIRDSGIFHRLQQIEDSVQMESNPKLGSSFEGYALEVCAKALGKKDDELFFWATHSGAELDLLWMHGGKTWGIEFKYSDAPTMTKSMTHSLTDLDLAHLWVVYPGHTSYPIREQVTVLPLSQITAEWRYPE